jgi:hypothetical protein
MEGLSHLSLAKGIHGEVWRLLEKKDRTPHESERMAYAAHASCYH